jgi:hypothetical protein
MGLTVGEVKTSVLHLQCGALRASLPVCVVMGVNTNSERNNDFVEVGKCGQSGYPTNEDKVDSNF